MITLSSGILPLLMLSKTIFLVHWGLSLFPFPWLPLCILLGYLLIAILYIPNIPTYCVPLPCGGLCLYRRAPRNACSYCMFTSCFPTIVPSIFIVLRNGGTPAGLLAWGFHTYVPCSCSTTMVQSGCTTLTFHSYLFPMCFMGSLYSVTR